MVLAHAGIPQLAGGIVGVDVFFVLSGYLITGLLLSEHAVHGRVDVLEFYARRLKRLLPGLLLMLLATTVTATLLLSPGELRQQAGSAGYAATWTSNLFFAHAQLDYFADLQVRDLFLHTWSLGVEEQFYLVWPWLLLAIVARRGTARPAALPMAALGVTSLALFAYWSAAHPLWAFYQMPARVWQFALGGLAWMLTHRSVWPLAARRVAEVVGLALVVGSALVLRPESPGLWLVVPSLGTALLLVAGAGVNAVTRVMAHQPLVWIGDRSYAWYLWHWPVLVLGTALGWASPGSIALLVALSLVLAALSYAVVERPCWQGRRARAVPARMTIVAAVVAIGLVLAGPVLQAHRTAHAPPSGEAVAITASRADVPELYAQGCDSWYHSAELNACLFGSENAPLTLVLLGDSLLMQWFALFRDLFPEPQWRIVVLTKSACPMVDEDFFYSRIGASFAICRQWRDAALTALPQLRPDRVVIGSSRYPFGERQWIDGSARVLTYLRSVAPRVLVVAPTPQLSFDGPGCLERSVARRGLARKDACAEPLASPDPITHYLKQAAAAVPGTALLDLSDSVCPQAVCAARSPAGAIIFRDSGHLTSSFARTLAPVARERLGAWLAPG